MVEAFCIKCTKIINALMPIAELCEVAEGMAPQSQQQSFVFTEEDEEYLRKMSTHVLPDEERT
jgi:hypothetical protein